MKPTRVGPKFQVVIPADVRKQAGLAPGDLVVAEAAPDGAIILRKKILADPSGHGTAIGSETGGRPQRGAQPRSGKHSTKWLDQLSPASMPSQGARPAKRMPAPDEVSTILKLYSDGKSSTDETLHRLAVDYGTLLSMLSASNLPWPRLPKAEREQMAKEFAGLWRRAESE
jgi:AbrB family looped-hinge helix DNA binding protein